MSIALYLRCVRHITDVINPVPMARRLPSINPSTVHAMATRIRLDASALRKAYDAAYIVGHTDTLIGASQNPTLAIIVNPATTRLREACRQSAEHIRQAEQRLTAALVTLAAAWPHDDSQPAVDFPVYRKASIRENRLQARREYATDPQVVNRLAEESRLTGYPPRPHGFNQED